MQTANCKMQIANARYKLVGNQQNQSSGEQLTSGSQQQNQQKMGNRVINFSAKHVAFRR